MKIAAQITRFIGAAALLVLATGCQSTPSAESTTVTADKAAATAEKPAGPKPLEMTDLVADKAGAQPSKAAINFTATASGGTTPIQYKWYVSPDINGPWKVLRDWSADNTYSWTPAAKGKYSIGVWARSANNTEEAAENGALKIVEFTITP